MVRTTNLIRNARKKKPRNIRWTKKQELGIKERLFMEKIKRRLTKQESNTKSAWKAVHQIIVPNIYSRGHSGRDRMVVWFTTTYAISAYHWCCEFESRSGRGVQHYVIKFLSDLRQVGGFLRILWFLPPIKMTATI